MVSTDTVVVVEVIAETAEIVVEIVVVVDDEFAEVFGDDVKTAEVMLLLMVGIVVELL